MGVILLRPGRFVLIEVLGESTNTVPDIFSALEVLRNSAVLFIGIRTGESGGSGFWQGMASGLGVALLLAVIGFLYLSANKPQGPRDASDWSPAPE